MAKSPDQEADESTNSDDKKFVCPICDEAFDSAKSRGMHRRWNHNNPWEDEEKLRQKYVEEQQSIPDIATEWECGETTIEQWLDKHNISTRDRGGKPDDAAYKDEETLRELYFDEEMSTVEMADRFGVSPSAVQSSMDRLGIDRHREKKYADKEWLVEKYCEEEWIAKEMAGECGCSLNTIYYHLEKHGIERFYNSKPSGGGMLPYSYIHHREDGQNYYVLTHRLVAYAHGKLEDFFDSDKSIHHKNGVHWINSPENLEVMSQAKHQEIHANERVESDFI